MPIIWKASFEEPLIRMHTLGKVDLVNAITTLYDASIKQGLPAAPGTPAGPLISGNTVAFKQALNSYFKVTAAQTQAKILKLYILRIKNLLSQIKNIQLKIKNTTIQIATIIAEIRIVTKKIEQLKNATTLEEKREAAVQLVILASLIAKLNASKAFIVKLKSTLLNVIKPKLQQLKDALKKITKKIILPKSQSSSIAIYKLLVTKIKELIQEFKKKKAAFYGGIKILLEKIKTSANVLKSYMVHIPKEFLSLIRNLISTILKSTNITSVVTAATSVLGIIEGLPDSKLSKLIKLVIRNAITNIIEIKNTILIKKRIFIDALKQKFNDKKKQLISRFKPKVSGPSKIVERKQDIKQLKNLFLPLKNTIKKSIAITLILNEIKKEGNKVASMDPKSKYSSNTKLATLLNNNSTGSGDIYSKIVTPDNAKIFLILALAEYTSKLEIVSKYKKKIKDRISQVKKTLAKKKVNKQELLFNSFLRLAVIGYWTAGTMPNLGIVTSPGTLSLPVAMKPTANSANFVRSLSKALQAHTKTVVGTYTTSTTPPVVLPWVGYL